jgi:formylglycine-generating enzyme required for sulfatase activity/predicted Ser/Thr protein kinase
MPFGHSHMEKIGKYIIQGEIGKGGMGVVYRGLDPYIGRTLAIKTIRLDILGQDGGRQDALKRFLREAQAAGNLSHPNIVTIFDVGEHEGMIYIAMEYIAGCSLETLLQQGRVFTLEEITRLFAQIASALDYAHGQGIVHRDIKPANILVGRDLKVSLVDFGIARTAASTMTQTGMLMGTPRYMSPEQIAGKRVDSRSDVFSLGAILYELLTRHNPFDGESITTVIYKIMHAELPPLSDFNKRLPPGMETVVRRALARDPDCRYRTCGELLADLQACHAARDEEPLREGGRGPEQTRRLEPAEKTVFAEPGRKRTRLFLPLAALLMVLAAAAVFLLLSGRRDVVPAPSGEEALRPYAVAQEDAAATDQKLPVESTPIMDQEAGKPPTGAAMEKPLPATAVAPAGSTVEKPPPATAVAPAGAAMEPPPPAIRTSPSTPALNRQGYEEQVFFNDTVMVRIPEGYFTVGSRKGDGNDDEHPAHRVFISDFWLGKTEVTFAQFDAFCSETGRPLPADEGWGRGNRPVINVTWKDADGYCLWLARKTGRRFRLPSEAEWEKAARERYPWGANLPSADHANMKGDDDGFAFTAPAGSFPAGSSPYGILDMAGNVWEWTADWYAPKYYRQSPQRDPLGPVSGTTRSVRGGSWSDGSDLIRSANRSDERPDRRLNKLGFRLAMDSR